MSKSLSVGVYKQWILGDTKLKHPFRARGGNRSDGVELNKQIQCITFLYPYSAVPLQSTRYRVASCE